MVTVRNGVFDADPYAIQPDAIVLPSEVAADSPVLVVEGGRVGFAGHRQAVPPH